MITLFVLMSLLAAGIALWAGAHVLWMVVVVLAKLLLLAVKVVLSLGWWAVLTVLVAAVLLAKLSGVLLLTALFMFVAMALWGVARRAEKDPRFPLRHADTYEYKTRRFDAAFARFERRLNNLETILAAECRSRS